MKQAQRGIYAVVYLNCNAIPCGRSCRVLQSIIKREGSAIQNVDFVIEHGVLKEYTGDGGDVVIPAGVITIGQDAFSRCEGLSSVVIPEGATKIEQYAFSGCKTLINVMIPQSVMTIEGNAFEGCTGLRSVVIPQGVTTIERDAFSVCTSLRSVTIPASVTEIGENAFDGGVELIRSNPRSSG